MFRLKTICLLLVISVVFGDTSSLADIQVYTANDQACYRIPALIRSRSGTLLFFAEKREPSCGDDGVNDIVIRTSTDGGQTLSDETIVVSGRSEQIDAEYRDGHAIANPSPVELVGSDESSAGPIMILFTSQNNYDMPGHHDSQSPGQQKFTANFVAWSFDDGKSWEDPKRITFPSQTLGGFDIADREGCMVGPGPGVAVRIAGGGNVDLGDVQVPSQGLFFTCHGGRPREGEENMWGDDRQTKRSMILYTLDLGETWLAAMWPEGDKDVFESTEGAFEQDEAALALVHKDGAPYLVQNVKTFLGKRAHILWDISDIAAGKGSEVALEQQGVFPPTDDLLKGASCAGDVTALKNNVFISAAHGDDRSDLKITQLKPGFPWQPSESNTAQEISVEEGPAAYSSIAGWEEGDQDVVGIFFEAGTDSSEWGPKKYSWIVFRSYAVGPLESDDTTIITTISTTVTTQHIETTTTVETTTVEETTQQIETTAVETTTMAETEISKSSAQAFCCVFSMDLHDPCGTCDNSAKLSSDSFCGESRANCDICTKGEAAWCPSRSMAPLTEELVLKKYSATGGRIYEGAPVASIATAAILGAVASFVLVTFGGACFHSRRHRMGEYVHEGLACASPPHEGLAGVPPATA